MSDVSDRTKEKNSNLKLNESKTYTLVQKSIKEKLKKKENKKRKQNVSKEKVETILLSSSKHLEKISSLFAHTHTHTKCLQNSRQANSV